MTNAKNTTSSANGKSEATAGDYDDVRNVTPIVPEQKTETAKDAAEVFVEAEEKTTKLDKLKAFAKKNQRVLVGAGATVVTTLLVLNARRNFLAAQVEDEETGETTEV
jgi:hypothetical protein